MVDAQPSLDDYPGYFPAGKPPFWTRSKVGTAAGIAGLLLGVGIGGSSPAGQSASGAAFTQSDLDRAVTAAKAQASAAATQQQGSAGDATKLAALRAQLARQKADAAAVLRSVKRDARAAQKAAVAHAVAQAVAAVKAQASTRSAPTTPLQQQTSPSGGTDPRFSYCYQAIAAGYGPYVRGQDPEYYWYTDADGDGVVCER